MAQKNTRHGNCPAKKLRRDSKLKDAGAECHPGRRGSNLQPVHEARSGQPRDLLRIISVPPLIELRLRREDRADHPINGDARREAGGRRSSAELIRRANGGRVQRWGHIARRCAIAAAGRTTRPCGPACPSWLPTCLSPRLLMADFRRLIAIAIIRPRQWRSAAAMTREAR